MVLLLDSAEMSLSLATIFQFYHGELCMFKKAEKLFKAGNLYEFHQDRTSFSAKVLASLKSVSYDPHVSSYNCNHYYNISLHMYFFFVSNTFGTIFMTSGFNLSC